MEGHARLRSVPYTAPGEDSPWAPYPGHPFSARGRPAQKPRFGAARAVMQAGVAAVQIAVTRACRCAHRGVI
jgi:hypothetical protein